MRATSAAVLCLLLFVAFALLPRASGGDPEQPNLTPPAAATAGPPAPVPVEPSPELRVTLRKGSGEEFAITGWIIPGKNPLELNLRLVGGSVLRCPRDQVVRIEEVGEDEHALPVLGDGKRSSSNIVTRHRVDLKNGNTLQGTVEEPHTPGSLRLRIGSLGVVFVPREDVERIEEVTGELIRPVRRERDTPGRGPTVPWEPPPAVRDAREALLDQAVDEFLRDGLEGTLRPSLRVSRKIDQLIRELSRHRTRNRVRAERHLRRLGSIALPQLTSAADHPFHLTRIAVMRLVRDYGDPRGVPLAIRALDDPEKWVRTVAHEALLALMDERVPYRPTWSPARRQLAQDRYREIWLETARHRLREALDRVHGDSPLGFRDCPESRWPESRGVGLPI